METDKLDLWCIGRYDRVDQLESFIWLISSTRTNLTCSCKQVDGSKKTGCFDLTCPGFVQTSHEIALGAAIYPISVPYGLPYEIIVYIFKVRKNMYLMSARCMCGNITCDM